MRRRLNARTGALAATGLLLGVPAWAGPITVWVDPAVPEVKTVEKVDLQTGGTLHLDERELLYPPAPEIPADQKHLDQIPAAIEAGKARWDEFEVELPIATDLKAVLADVTLVRSARDRDDLVRALLFQGAAVARAFPASAFDSDERAAAWRTSDGTSTVPTAWLDAYALTGKPAERADLIDGTAWQDYQRFSAMISGMSKGTVTVPDGVGQVFVDGQEREVGDLSLAPGLHYAHVVRGDIVTGRQVFRVAPGASMALPTAVSVDEVQAARDATLLGRRGMVPDPVVDVVDVLSTHHDGAVYFAVADARRPAVLTMTQGAALKDTTLVTHVLYGEVGGGVMVTNAFLENVNDNGRPLDTMMVAGAASGSLGYELGVSYFMATVGIDGMITPGATLPYGDRPATTFDAVSAHPQPFIGIGAYALRPTKPAPTFAIAATVQYLGPSWLGFGGRMNVGVPIDADKHTWFRIGLGGAYAIDSYSSPAVLRPAITGFLRIGFGAGL